MTQTTNLKYPYRLEKDDNGTYLVTFVDFPGATYGKDEEEAHAMAQDLLETALLSTIRTSEEVPAPSKAGRGARYAVPSALVASKVMLYQTMQNAGVSQSELSRRLGKDPKIAQRLLDLSHHSKLEQIEQAFNVLGYQLTIGLEAR